MRILQRSFENVDIVWRVTGSDYMIRGLWSAWVRKRPVLGINSDADIAEQKDHNSALVRKAIFTAPGAAASSTCLLSPKRSLPAKLKSPIK